MYKDAYFSDDRKYRYLLTRIWGEESKGIPLRQCALFIGLNPSTADETEDDPTIRRCIGYAKAWGYGGLIMANIFAFRATNPRDMFTQEDPVGPENDEYLILAHKFSGISVAAWGTHGKHRNRDLRVKRILDVQDSNGEEKKLHCLRLTSQGHPAHPLYLPANLKPIIFR